MYCNCCCLGVVVKLPNTFHANRVFDYSEVELPNFDHLHQSYINHPASYIQCRSTNFPYLPIWIKPHTIKQYESLFSATHTAAITAQPIIHSLLNTWLSTNTNYHNSFLPVNHKVTHKVTDKVCDHIEDQNKMEIETLSTV